MKLLHGIDFASIKDRPRDDSRSGRGRGRGERSERGGRSRRSVEETPVEAEAVVEATATPAVEAEAAPQRTRSRKKTEAKTTPAPQKITKSGRARRTCGLPLAWFRRACDLRRNTRAKIKALLTPGSAEEQRLKDAALRADLTAWLLHG